MKIGKILKGLKKGSKASKGKDGAKAGSAFDWPSGMRIGVYGHANSGKTVYFTVLNEECKIGRKLQISVTDNSTAGEFLSNYRAIWGLGTATDAGTVVDLRAEKAFPEPTEKDKVLLFNSILNRSRKIPVVSYDYNGKNIAISQSSEEKEKIIDFMIGCDGLMFFFDPKILKAELQCQSHVASFIGMLESLAPLHKRLNIPISLVIMKADTLPGFFGDEQTVLISPEDENFLSEDFEIFLERVMESNRITSNSEWSTTVRDILIKLREFLKIVVGRTLNFQIYFVSCTGQTPEKIGTDVGRSIYAPPARMRPVGVKEPFYRLLNTIQSSKRITAVGKLAKYIAYIALIWIALYSAPFLYHFKFLLPQATRVEDGVLKANSGNIYGATERERGNIVRAYQKYEMSWVVRNLFPEFRSPSTRISQKYSTLNEAEGLKRLDSYTRKFTMIVRDTSLWPKLNPSNDSLMLNKEHLKLESDLNGLHTGDDETSRLFTSSGRILVYWDIFKKSIQSHDDTTIWETIHKQVAQDQNLYGKEVSKDETELGKALTERKIKKAKKEVAKKVSIEFDDVIDNINNNNKPSFRLGQAVRDLKKIRSKLDPATDRENISRIDRYIAAAKKWEKRQVFKGKVESLPDDGHIHIEVTKKGESPAWADFSQLFEGDEIIIEWKIGDEIHIAFDEPSFQCKFGKEASDRKPLTGKYSLFDMKGDVTFSNIGKTVTFSFSPGIIDQLPEL